MSRVYPLRRNLALFSDLEIMKGTKSSSYKLAVRDATPSATALGGDGENNKLYRSPIDTRGKGSQKRSKERNLGRTSRAHKPTACNPHSESQETIECYTRLDHRVNQYKLKNDLYNNFKYTPRDQKSRTELRTRRRDRKCAYEVSFLSGSHGEWTMDDDIDPRRSRLPRWRLYTGMDAHDDGFIQAIAPLLSVVRTVNGRAIVDVHDQDVEIVLVDQNPPAPVQINGNNGEATNSDDQDRKHKEAKNKLHQKKVNGQRRDENDHTPVRLTPVVQQPQPQPPQNQPLQPAIDMVYGTTQAHIRVFREEIFYYEDANLPIDTVFLPSGSMIMARKQINAYTFVVSTDNTLNVYPFRVPDIFITWTFTHEGEHFSGAYFPYWVQENKSKFNIACMNDSVYRMVEGYIRRSGIRPYGAAIERLVAETVDYTLFSWRDRLRRQGERGHLGDPSVYETSLHNDWSRHTAVVGTLKLGRMYREEAQILCNPDGTHQYLEWTPRSDVKIRLTKGSIYYLEPGQKIGDQPNLAVAPHNFPRGSRLMSQMGTPPSKWYTTFYTRFTGLRHVPKCYERCEHNAIEALKRVCGEKDFYCQTDCGELMFNNLGFSLSMMLYKKHRIPTQVWGARFVDGKPKRGWITFDFVNMTHHSDIAWFGDDPKEVFERYFNFPYDSTVELQRKLVEHWCERLEQQSNDFFLTLSTVVTNVQEVVKSGATVTYGTLKESLYSFFDHKAARDVAKEIRHHKKFLRQIYANGLDWKPVGYTGLENTVLNLKRETCKFGKAPRLFMAYVAACMVANELPEFVKEFLDGDYFVGNGSFEFSIRVFAKRRPDDIQDFFRDAYLLPEGEGLIAIYSDDSCLIYRRGGVLHMYNVDISSCDASQRDFPFHLVYLLMGCFNKEMAELLVKQCMVPMHLEAQQEGACELKINVDGPFEGSGTVLTTILNHVSCYSGWWVFTELTKGTKNPTVTDIELAFATVGHKVSVTKCVCFEDIQFLKYSPMFGENGKVYAVKNDGAILRNFGGVEGDLTHTSCNIPLSMWKSMNWSERMECYLSNIIEGFKNEPSTPIMQALRTRFNRVVGPIEPEFHRMERDEVCNINIDVASWLRRYRCTSQDLQVLVAQLSHAEFGTFYSSVAMDSILTRDYDYPE